MIARFELLYTRFEKRDAKHRVVRPDVRGARYEVARNDIRDIRMEIQRPIFLVSDWGDIQ